MGQQAAPLTQTHKITICTSCKKKGDKNRLGFELIEKLRDKMDALDPKLAEKFHISGAACMAGCDHVCTVAYHGKNKASYLFGDIENDQDIEDMINFAKQYSILGDGWCSSVDRPGKLRKNTLARIPATMIFGNDQELGQS